VNRTEASTLTTQRCLHHGLREAVARCPQCRHFFCRECIAEHDDRILCASCLKKVSERPERAPRRRPSPWPLVQLGVGLASAWLLFYAVGRLLLALPSEFHEASLWDAGFLNATKQSDQDE